MFYAITLSAILAGCGSDNSSNDNSSNDNSTNDNSSDEYLPIIGTWQTTDDDDNTVYYLFNSESFEFYSYVEGVDCHTNLKWDISNLSATSLTVNNKTENYTIEGNTLTLDNDFTLTRSTSTPDFISCADPDTTGTLTVSVEFVSLPDSFTTPDTTDEDEYTKTFDLEITFDLASDNPEAVRELNIHADYYIEGEQSSTTVSMTDLSSSTYLYLGGDRDYSMTTAPYSISGNTVTFTFARGDHKILKEITNTTPIRVSASFRDINGDSQSDYYPDSGYTSGIEVTDLTDNEDDINGQSSPVIVDIKSITVSVTE
jgi:hypothetical protein